MYEVILEQDNFTPAKVTFANITSNKAKCAKGIYEINELICSIQNPILRVSNFRNKESQKHAILQSRAAVSTSPLARGYWILGPG